MSSWDAYHPHCWLECRVLCMFLELRNVWSAPSDVEHCLPFTDCSVQNNLVSSSVFPYKWHPLSQRTPSEAHPFFYRQTLRFSLHRMRTLQIAMHSISSLSIFRAQRVWTACQKSGPSQLWTASLWHQPSASLWLIQLLVRHLHRQVLVAQNAVRALQ